MKRKSIFRNSRPQCFLNVTTFISRCRAVISTVFYRSMITAIKFYLFPSRNVAVSPEYARLCETVLYYTSVYIIVLYDVTSRRSSKMFSRSRDQISLPHCIKNKHCTKNHDPNFLIIPRERQVQAPSISTNLVTLLKISILSFRRYAGQFSINVYDLKMIDRKNCPSSTTHLTVR